jgi:hypothetical protein
MQRGAERLIERVAGSAAGLGHPELTKSLIIAAKRRLPSST